MFFSPQVIKKIDIFRYLCASKFKNYMISIDGLAVEFGGTTLFSDISFVINEKDRIALMGKNGAGKSTLLKILAGVRQPTRGKVSAPKDCVVAYLPQHLMTEDGRTVFAETAQAFGTDRGSVRPQRKILLHRRNQLRRGRREIITRTRLHTRRFSTSDERLQRRLAHAHRSRQTAAAKTGRTPS